MFQLWVTNINSELDETYTAIRIAIGISETFLSTGNKCLQPKKKIIKQNTT